MYTQDILNYYNTGFDIEWILDDYLWGLLLFLFS